MKVAITGGTAGIGKALGDVYEMYDHEVLRLSRRTGINIRSIPKAADAIQECDLFINNAQAGFAQTELLYEVFRRWKGDTGKKIISISTDLVRQPFNGDIDLSLYCVQKIALEEALMQLRRIDRYPSLVLVRPGMVATQDWQTVPPAATVESWANAVFRSLHYVSSDLEVTELTILPKHDA